MSDFTSNFWSVYVAGITLAGIFGCLLLLWFSGKTKAMTDSDNTTGHVWDGDLREMNNPLPRWWVWLFVITVVFSLAYLVLYPGLGTFPGTLKWTTLGQHSTEMAAAASAAGVSLRSISSKRDGKLGLGKRLLAFIKPIRSPGQVARILSSGNLRAKRPLIVGLSRRRGEVFLNPWIARPCVVDPLVDV